MTRIMASERTSEGTNRQTAATEQRIKKRGGKSLTFVLDNEEYGLEILKVQEIIGMMDITPVPRTPEFIRGVVNLRGKIVPIVDLRLKFGMPAAERTSETCIIVVEANRVQTGIVVDQVREVLDIAEEEIEDPPSFGTDVTTDYILGIGKSQGHVKLLLDIDRAMADGTLERIAAIAEAARGEERAEDLEPAAVSG